MTVKHELDEYKEKYDEKVSNNAGWTARWFGLTNDNIKTDNNKEFVHDV